MESLKAALLLKESYARMPTDEEVRSAFVVKDVYNFRSRNYLLRKLENFDRKERVDVDSYTIEHVMPQNPDLSPEWQEELGPDWKAVQEKYLHTIGNLTLTGYNPELSDRPVQREADDEGRLPRQPAAPEPLPGPARALERGGDPEARRAARRPGAAGLAGAEAAGGDAGEVPQDEGQGGTVYTLEDHPALAGPIGPLFDEFRKRVLNLDAGVHEEVRKQYIAYKLTTNFVEVVPLASELKLYLDIAIEELDDPHELGRDVSGVGHWGTGDVEVRLSSIDQLEDVMALVRQVVRAARARRATRSRSGHRPA